MRKLLSGAAAIAAVICMSGCIAQMPDGYNDVKAAKENYEKLNSAHTTMFDLSTGDKIMDFSFYINNSGEMILSYYGKDGADEMYAYSNGAEYFYKDAGDELWSVIGADDESYIYNIYNREYRYPYADGGIFFLDGGSVESFSVTDKPDGGCTIVYVYDADKLNASAVEMLDGVSGFDSLETTFEINADGYITDFTEKGTVTDADGVSREVNMRISVDMMNEVYEIPYPVDRVNKSK
ncbi:MAG: hypothetical protein IJD85_03805 [Oscillospiraceae bacterium]|nr:hypothetical protein [Oscillospiraceae bacterium]